MLDYEGIKELAKTLGMATKDLLALSPQTDPFYAGLPYRREAAEWFAAAWEWRGGQPTHLRGMHYALFMTEGSPPMPDGQPYTNTKANWKYLVAASLSARYLDLVPEGALRDHRNDEPIFFAADEDPTIERRAQCSVVDYDVGIDLPEMPSLPNYSIDIPRGVQNFIIEIWIEKSSQNDWLVPLCKKRGVNLLVGTGEQSETRARELAIRSSEYKAPVRVIYISDFDPAGRSMPKAVARKVEFTIDNRGLEDVDFQLIPLLLSPGQIKEYDLPAAPDSDSRRGAKFRETFGIGITELDALQEKHPGEMERIVVSELDKFLDPDLHTRSYLAAHDQVLAIRKLENAIVSQYNDEVVELEEKLNEISESLQAWNAEVNELWTSICEDLEDNCPDISQFKTPLSEAPGTTDRFVLFDSTRTYLDQMDWYNAWKDGEE